MVNELLTYHNVRFTHISKCIIHNAYSITEGAKMDIMYLCSKTTSPIRLNCAKNYGCISYLFIA